MLGEYEKRNCGEHGVHSWPSKAQPLNQYFSVPWQWIICPAHCPLTRPVMQALSPKTGQTNFDKPCSGPRHRRSDKQPPNLPSSTARMLQKPWSTRYAGSACRCNCANCVFCFSLHTSLRLPMRDCLRYDACTAKGRAPRSRGGGVWATCPVGRRKKACDKCRVLTCVDASCQRQQRTPPSSLPSDIGCPPDRGRRASRSDQVSDVTASRTQRWCGPGGRSFG